MTTMTVVYAGRRHDAKGRLSYLYHPVEDGQPTDRVMLFGKPMSLAQRPGTILELTPADSDGSYYTRGENAPRVTGAVAPEMAASWDAQDRATWATDQRKRADVQKAQEATDLRTYLAPIHDAYVNLNPQARSTFLALVIDAVIDPRYSKR